ncbi:phosphatidylinositol mannoside acyltransferase [Corynebacterium anserum]|uniref:Phosphatidylinositol mannoside acyltransferase n=1 Tax=Corynebacterium anserum TaxID=2684406 RepID=A0A7G7YNL1_9CORY|nr:phosphatidylinositol mannoside acyltransferase [Corynebacterium anserum]MBC2681658.1 phosphatidylinositol mannoside acyltransferase [Corynebacterium anserum]QNH96081.1 phosphatidylinositol mannoside acyltransferase [Corynebacterium anserum]
MSTDTPTPEPTYPQTGLSWTQKLSAWSYKAGWALTKRLPPRVAAVLFNIGADAASKRGRGLPQLRRNLARVVGEEKVTDELIRASMRSYMRYWREAFQLPAIAGPELAAKINKCVPYDVHQKISAALAAGKGVVITLPHSANWDMAGMWLVNYYSDFTTVAERLRPESLFEAFVEYRRSLGFDVIALTGADQPPMERLAHTLADNRVVCLMGERDITGHGVEVEFFGERCAMPAGSALLAQRAGCPLYAANLWYEGEDSWGIAFSDAINTNQPLDDVVQEQARWFEQFIAEHPQDWHMLQPIWFSDLSEQRLRRMGVAFNEDHRYTARRQDKE